MEKGDWNEPGDAKEVVEPGPSLLQVKGEVPPQERVRSHLQKCTRGTDRRVL